MNYVLDSSTRFQVSQKMLFDVIDAQPQGFVKEEERFSFRDLTSSFSIMYRQRTK